MFPIRNGLKQGDALSPLLSTFALEYAIRRIQINQDGLKLSGIVRLKRDGTRAETRFLLSPKGTSPFKSAGASVQLTAGSRGVRISGSNAEYTRF